MKTVHKPRRLFEEPAEDVEYVELHNLKEFILSNPFPVNQEFQPSVYYNSDGDGFEIYWEPESFYVEVRNGLHLHIGFDSGKVVGVTFWSVKHRQGLREVKDGGETASDLPFVPETDPRDGMVPGGPLPISGP